MIISRFGSGAYSAPKIGSERGARNVDVFNIKKTIDSMIFLPFGLQSFFGAKNRSERGARNV